LFQSRSSSVFFALSSLLASLFFAQQIALPALAAPQSRSQSNSGPVSTPVSTYSNLTELSYRARERFEAEPKNPEAAYNFAVYQLMIGDMQYAQQIFTKAVELKADDFLSHLGLAQSIANAPAGGGKPAQIEMARAQALALSASGSAQFRAGQLDRLGKTYLAMDNPEKALALYQKAYLLQPKSRQILQMLVRSALAAKNLKVAGAHLNDLVVGSINERQLLLAMATNCPALASSGGMAASKLERFILDQMKANHGTDAGLFYTLGRNFEASKCFSTALQCYGTAVALAPEEGQYVLAHCARLVADGKRQPALAELKVVASKSLSLEPSPRRLAVAGTIAAGVKYLTGSAQLCRASLMEASHLSCNCKIATFNYLLRRMPGVVYARIIESKGPHNLLVYDPAITSDEKAWAKLGRDVTYKIEPRLSRTIVDFPTLVQIVLTNYEMAPTQGRKYYEFEPMPLKP
jgi:tetratricopeptide (TPR) repeat protein